ncbi:MAG: putative anti-sigma regulatory factor, serine/threonine protein kinase [Gemmatimonadales bacterium]|jgi:anti-sigma regulatory factor (Ser/Thr protein kinase)|nr:putative anti-sigma regulatory factor, serine/threonine protein kinase [Gemmatimonadales bacterium]
MVIPVTRWSRMFSGTPASVGEARKFACLLAAGHRLVDAVELVVSELATNAVDHTATGAPGGCFVVEVEVYPARVWVAVVDMGADTSPVPSDDDPSSVKSVAGRGLFLVDALAAKWGSEPVRVGRRVWADIHQDLSW